MNNSELSGKVNSAVYQQMQQRGYAAPVDVLIDIGVLTKQNYESWRFGKVDYLEKVCSCNLSKLTFIMKQIRSYSQKAGYKPSYCCYKQWGAKKPNGQGHKPVILLRFSKSGAPEIEKAYATHYVDTARCEELKAAKAKNNIESDE